jgi:hypothetical protein
MAVRTETCPYCHLEVPAVELTKPPVVPEPYPKDAFDTVPSGRHFYLGTDLALLHHDCASRQIETNWQGEQPWWIPERNWWACQHPDRDLDQDVRFELHCPECALRWAEGNL